MKKIFFLSTAFIIIMFASCQKKKNITDIEKQIAKYKEQIATLNKKIKQLQSQISDSSTISEGIYVDTLHLNYQNYTHYVEVSGTAIAQKDIIITPEINGQIKRIYVKEGQYVKKGQLLVKLKDDVLRNNLAQLQTQFFFADTMFQKQKELYEKNLISEAQYLQSKNRRDVLLKNIETIKSQLKMTYINAPFTGIVDQIFAKEGQMAAPSVRILELVNLNSLYAETNISEKYIPYIHINDPITIKVPLYGNLQEKSHISWISNVIDPNSRTIKIKAPIKNISRKIKPNMSIIIKFRDYNKKHVIVLPSNALTKDLKGWYVYTIKKQGDKYLAEKKYVNIDIADQSKTVIKNGLTPKDIIIISGINMLRDGSQIIIK